MIIHMSQENIALTKSYVQEILESGNVSHGKFNKILENKWTNFTKCDYACTVSSGGAGIECLLNAVDVRNKFVLLPVNTFAATLTSVIKAGGIPIILDVSLNDMCLSFDSIKNAITQLKLKNTTNFNIKDIGAVLLVHIGGHIAFETEKIHNYLSKLNIPLIHDAAHAHGATINGKSLDTIGVGAAYSFYATKTMPTGEGGIVGTNHRDVYEFIQRHKSYGKETIDGSIYFPNFGQEPVGANFRMSEITAAIGCVQVDELPKIIKFKRKLAKKYDKMLKGTAMLFKIPKHIKSGYYKYIIKAPRTIFPVIPGETGQVFDNAHQLHNIIPIINTTSDSGLFENADVIGSKYRCLPVFYTDKKNYQKNLIKTYKEYFEL